MNLLMVVTIDLAHPSALRDPGTPRARRPKVHLPHTDSPAAPPARPLAPHLPPSHPPHSPPSWLSTLCSSPLTEARGEGRFWSGAEKTRIDYTQIHPTGYGVEQGRHRKRCAPPGSAAAITRARATGGGRPAVEGGTSASHGTSRSLFRVVPVADFNRKWNTAPISTRQGCPRSLDERPESPLTRPTGSEGHRWQDYYHSNQAQRQADASILVVAGRRATGASTKELPSASSSSLPRAVRVNILMPEWFAPSSNWVREYAIVRIMLLVNSEPVKQKFNESANII
ncbi:hypothetical protein C8R44DRAFT_745288 [Mycena epipterygia]|nr:hypothetical protein C8R44DRAFT_745288 [Mycena epipterygia]